MLSTDKITEIFCLVDDFCKKFDSIVDKKAIKEQSSIKRRNRAFTMSESEIITIMILFHSGGQRILKDFYLTDIQKYLTSYFPKTVSYNRFVELQKKTVVKMALFLKTYCIGKCTGISFIDSTPLRACHIKREKQNKVFKGIAAKGQCSIGWFYGLKLHIIINEKGELLDFMITPGNTDDREPLKFKNFHKKIFGKLFGDKGYISQDLFEQLFVDGVHLVTKPRKNMKNSLMHLKDKIYLRKRALIETVNDQLKNICQVEHTRHRSFDNFIVNLLSGLIAYSLFEKKPSLNIEIIDYERLIAAA